MKRIMEVRQYCVVSYYGLDVVFLHRLAPKFHLICEKLALHVRAAELQRDLHCLDAALDRRFAQCLCQRIAKTVDDVARRAPCCEAAPPRGRNETRKTTFDHSWNFGQTGAPGCTGLDQSAQLAAADLRCGEG